MKAYKGFDKDLKCRGFQYEIGKEYHEDKSELCKKGFHACENPLDCFGYYDPGTSRYCEVEIDDNGERQNLDTKVCGEKIKIGAELCVGDIVKSAFSFVKERCTDKKNGGDRSALQGGHGSALQGGDRSALQGGYGSALQGGDRSALQGGDRSALQGGHGSALQGGYGSALQGGDRSVLYGGRYATVRGGMHSVLALQHWKDGRFVGVKAKVVDGKKILPNVWYKLDSIGRFIKAGDESCK